MTTTSIHVTGRQVATAVVTTLGRAYYRVVALLSRPVLAATPSRVVVTVTPR